MDPPPSQVTVSLSHTTYIPKTRNLNTSDMDPLIYLSDPYTSHMENLVLSYSSSMNIYEIPYDYPHLHISPPMIMVPRLVEEEFQVSFYLAESGGSMRVAVVGALISEISLEAAHQVFPDPL